MSLLSIKLEIIYRYAIYSELLKYEFCLFLNIVNNIFLLSRRRSYLNSERFNQQILKNLLQIQIYFFTTACHPHAGICSIWKKKRS